MRKKFSHEVSVEEFLKREIWKDLQNDKIISQAVTAINNSGISRIFSRVNYAAKQNVKKIAEKNKSILFSFVRLGLFPARGIIRISTSSGVKRLSSFFSSCVSFGNEEFVEKQLRNDWLSNCEIENLRKINSFSITTWMPSTNLNGAIVPSKKRGFRRFSRKIQFPQFFFKFRNTGFLASLPFPLSLLSNDTELSSSIRKIREFGNLELSNMTEAKAFDWFECVVAPKFLSWIANKDISKIAEYSTIGCTRVVEELLKNPVYSKSMELISTSDTELAGKIFY
eukprot:GHVP01025998.1.p1 GENE.GHVP01025998.1~~GHVP01025998.1.p1  ORF type:complete len:282 (+),score=54.46 GHVP01025998.1:503-1348(+)